MIPEQNLYIFNLFKFVFNFFFLCVQYFSELELYKYQINIKVVSDVE